MTDYWPLLILAAVILGCILARLWITPTWGTVRDTGVWHYQRNRKTGERRVCRTSFDGYQPVDWAWVRTGKWHPGLLPRPEITPHVKHGPPSGHRAALWFLTAALCLLGAPPVAAYYTLSRGAIKAGPYSPRSCRAVDGDTIKCRLARSVRTIRLVGLDTPELHIACERARALDAQAAMNGLLKSGRIAVREFRVMSRDVPGIPQPSLDRYGRRLAEVSVAGQDVVKAMIASGKGRPYDGGTRGPWSGC